MAEPRGGLGSKIGSAFIEVGTTFIGFGDNLASEIANSLSSKAFAVGNVLESFGQAVFSKFSVPLLAATGANIANFQALDREIRTVLTLFGTAPSLVEESFGKMRDGIREVSKEVGGLERDIGAGLYQTISAGIPEGDAFAFLDVAQMAAIADRSSDLTTAVDGLSTVLNAFNLEATETTAVSDAMFQTVAAGKTTFGELSNDIGRVAPLAANAGVEFEELFAIIGSLTLQGLQTSESISFLRAAITGVLRPTDELNTIFQDLGFASAEVAIPVLGLQGAFAAVTAAAGGSTSRLQELIGTSEGVSAILGVTGDNAGRFGQVLEGVSNAAGSTQRAFDIMDQGVGRTFGRMTEAFDRLSNTFGEMASSFAVPVLVIATDVLNRMSDIFVFLSPLVSEVAVAFGKLISILDFPIVKQFAAILGVIGLSIFGLVGSTGLWALTLGKVLKRGAEIIFLTKTFGKLRAVMDSLGGVSLITAQKVGGLVARLAPGPIGAISTAFAKLGAVIGATGTKFATAALGFGVLTVALAAVTFGVVKFINHQKEAKEALDTFGKSSDKLSQSMGLLNQDWGSFNEETEESVSNLQQFEDANRAAIQEIENVLAVAGQASAIDLAESFLIEQILSGNAPKDLVRLQDLIERSQGFELGFDVEDISTNLELITELIGGVEAKIKTAQESTDFFGNGMEAAGKALAVGFDAARVTGTVDVFLAELDRIKETLDPHEANQLGAAFMKGLEETFEDTDFNPFGSDPSDIFEEGVFEARAAANNALSEGAFQIPYELIPLPNTFDIKPPVIDLQGGPGIGAVTAEMLQFADDFGLTVSEIIRIGEDGIDTYKNVLDSTAEAFADAEASIQESMDSIRDRIQSQNPFLDIYEGKVEQSFAAWTKGQQQFRTDLGKIEEARVDLENTFGQDSPIVDLFNQAPVEKQAWLAYLGDNLPAAMEELAATQLALDENADTIISRNFDSIVAPIEAELNASLLAIQGAAEDAGRDTAAGFVTEFSRQFGMLPGITQRILDETRALLNGSLPSPSFTDPRFGQPTGSGSFTEPTQPSELDDKRSRVSIEGDLVIQATGSPEQQAADFLGTVGTLLEQNVYGV